MTVVTMQRRDDGQFDVVIDYGSARSLEALGPFYNENIARGTRRLLETMFGLDDEARSGRLGRAPESTSWS